MKKLTKTAANMTAEAFYNESKKTGLIMAIASGAYMGLAH